MGAMAARVPCCAFVTDIVELKCSKRTGFNATRSFIFRESGGTTIALDTMAGGFVNLRNVIGAGKCTVAAAHTACRVDGYEACDRILVHGTGGTHLRACRSEAVLAPQGDVIGEARL
jgi:hypothetical protein